MSLKILVFSDIHADESALDGLRSLAYKKDYDAVICAGDLTNRGPVSFVEDLLNLWGDKIFFVHGNMDSAAVLDVLRPRPNYLHGRKIDFGEWNLVGLGGSNPTPFHTPSEYSERQIEHILRSADIDSRTILVSHPPPKGFFDKVAGDIHVGSESLRKIMDEKKPIILLCGHIHEHEGQKVVGDTLIIKIGSAEQRRAAEIVIADNIKVNFFSF
jgi:uncharacterized protein